MISSAPTAFVLALLAPVQFIVDLLHPVLLFFHNTVGVGWGMSIVLLTVCVRALLAPLTVKQFKSMQAMVRVAPQLKALQAKHKDDKQRQQQEVMKFYAENKINPFASCLPLVAQMPFFIGLFYLLRSDLRDDICGPAVVHAVKTLPCAQVAHHFPGSPEKFLFIPDLTVKATGIVLVVLIVLYVSSQLVSSILTPSSADRNQRMLMYALPFVFVFFVISFPSGLIVYWITTNLWTVTQGYVLRRRLGPVTAPKGEPAAAPAASDAEAPARVGLMARLAAATGGAKAAPVDEAPASDTPKRNGAAPAQAVKPAAAKERDRRSPAPKPKGRMRSSSKSSKSSSETSAATPAAKPARSGPPPQPPRKKKKRSGRRR
jgi:YidC/Oxa1 family membrane protein insertase